MGAIERQAGMAGAGPIMLPLRLGMGAIFVRTGYGKLTGLEGVEGFFGSLGIPAPGLFAVLVAVAEFFGGLGILAGVATRFSGGVLAIVMAVAIITARWADGGFDGSRLEIALLAAGVTLVFTGPGRYTLPKMMGKPELDLETPIWRKLKG